MTENTIESDTKQKSAWRYSPLWDGSVPKLDRILVIIYSLLALLNPITALVTIFAVILIRRKKTNKLFRRFSVVIILLIASARFVSQMNDVNDKLIANAALPECHSEVAADMVKQAMANSPTKNIINIQILALKDIAIDYGNDHYVSCYANAITNGGEMPVHYEFKWLGKEKGTYTVQIKAVE